VNVLVWELLAGCLWVAGAIVDGTARLMLWGLAVAVAYGGAGILHWLPRRGRRVALWWCYFQRTEAIGIKVAENAADAGGVGWWATWTLMLMVLALIGIAVGDELAIAHPGDEVTRGFTILAFGGPALFL